jgi:anthranilate synthase component 1
MSVVLGSYSPTLRELRSAHLDGHTVAISLELLADLDTPVSAYLKVRGAGPSFLLESVEGGEWLGRYSFIGASPRRVLRVKNGYRCFDGGEASVCLDPLHAIQSIVDAYRPATPALGRFEGGALGYLSYEAGRYFEQLPRAEHDALDLPDAAFFDVDTVLVFDHVARTIRVVSHAWLDRPLETAYTEAVDRIDQLVARLTGQLDLTSAPTAGTTAVCSNLSRPAFEHMVRKGKEHITAGDILQVVLSQRLQVACTGDAFGLYRRLRAVGPSPYMYYLDFSDHQIVGASPELLVQVEGQRVTSRPIAGTRRRGTTMAEDEALAQDLLVDEKERAEHLMLVDLARNDVGRVCRPGTVEVLDFMYVERFSHVMHLVSDVEGILRHDRSLYDVMRSCFPAGTVSGAPKIRAMQIIAELEPDCRGPYAGAVGFVNSAGNLEMAITIRTGVVKGGTLHVQAGAGIVADSNPEREFVESMNKARALLEAAGGME